MSNEKDDGIFFWGAMMVIIFLIVPLWYAAHSGSINGPLLALARGELKIFAAFSEEASEAYRLIGAANPENLSWDTVERVLHYAGSWIRWPYLVLLGILGAIAVHKGRTNQYVRRLDMDGLLKNNAASFPCLHPVVGRGNYLLSRESFDSGPWRIARTPVQFALENGLLLDADNEPVMADKALRNGLPNANLDAWGNCRFDEVGALEILRAQLGKKYEGNSGLTPCRLVLAGALLAYAAGDKKGCVALLDKISESYTEKDGQPLCPALEAACPKAEKILETQQAILSEKAISRHASYELPWFMALLYRARQKGVLATSQFIWLRPLDRPLWYALNQCGGRVAWAEALAPWAHYMTEEKSGRTYARPKVDAAVISLRQALSAQGWLVDASPPETPVTNLSGVEPLPYLVLYEAEDDPEYDANSDPDLANEQF